MVTTDGLSISTHFEGVFSLVIEIYIQKKFEIVTTTLIIIPLDHEFLVQQDFALCNWNAFLVCYFLIFEIVKLCRMNDKGQFISKEPFGFFNSSKKLTKFFLP